MSDRMLTKLGMAKALVSLAAIVAGIHDKDQALIWCVKQGFIRQGRNRDELILTQRGVSVVWLFWKAYKTGRLVHQGGNINPADWTTSKGDAHQEIDRVYLHQNDEAA